MFKQSLNKQYNELPNNNTSSTRKKVSAAPIADNNTKHEAPPDLPFLQRIVNLIHSKSTNESTEKQKEDIAKKFEPLIEIITLPKYSNSIIKIFKSLLNKPSSLNKLILGNSFSDKYPLLSKFASSFEKNEIYLEASSKLVDSLTSFQNYLDQSTSKEPKVKSQIIKEISLLLVNSIVGHSSHTDEPINKVKLIMSSINKEINNSDIPNDFNTMKTCLKIINDEPKFLLEIINRWQKLCDTFSVSTKISPTILAGKYILSSLDTLKKLF